VTNSALFVFILTGRGSRSFVCLSNWYLVRQILLLGFKWTWFI